jgi:DNA mismatch repair protein MutL
MNTERTDKMIKIMDELLANKIAAGEVVEKCASVVKELVENSIDALASEIKVELKESGLKEIKVSDNGIGMTKEDAKLSFFRHATSKIQTEDDLYHIETLGFRGEALASIASVSKVNLKTCMNDIGTEVVIEGGKIDIIKACETLKGTIITINDLFYNTPARLKHLKSLYTELANITEFMQKIALAKPNIKMALINDGNVVLKTDGSNNLLKTVSFIFGLETAKKMIEINGQNDDYVIKGYISEPELHKANRNGLITLVNGRVIRNADLNRAINDGYAGYKPENRYPIVVLNIEVDPYIVDVNVHPAKTEIKFSKLEELLSLVKELIKKALNKEVLIPKVTLPKQNFYQDTIDFNIVK